MFAQLKKDDLEFKDAFELLQKEKLLLNKAARYRKKVDITQPQLADKSRMTQQAVSRIERNEVSPTLKSFLESQFEELSKAYDKCKIINNKTYALSLEQVDPFGLYSYINVLFLIDIRMFYRVIRDIDKYRDELISLYTIIGELDALTSIASFGDNYPSLTEPELHAQGIKYEVEDMVHPLVANPVANSIILEDKGALITGSNMSGKSTFLRSLAVNAVLAQTICGTFTSKYIASFFKVTTSISQNDNLVGGKSYYLAEAEALLNMLNGVQSDIPSLCIVDEIKRGLLRPVSC